MVRMWDRYGNPLEDTETQDYFVEVAKGADKLTGEICTIYEQICMAIPQLVPSDKQPAVIELLAGIGEKVMQLKDMNNALKNEAEQLKKLATDYGVVNILNIHLSSRSGDRLLFPNDISNMNDRFAKLLFEMSTPLNENMIRLAQQKGYNIQNNGKGYVFNGNATDLINFLNIGTPQ